MEGFFPTVRVINLTQGGLKAMEELAKLEAERGNPEYAGVGSSKAGKGMGTENSASAYSDHGTGMSVKQRIASNEMCTFLILNISSLQLIPVNMIAYQQQYGSVNPVGIIAPAIVATAVSTAVVYCKVKDRKRRV